MANEDQEGQTCFDFSIGKCDRDNCKYIHSDVHIPSERKERRQDRGYDRQRQDRRPPPRDDRRQALAPARGRSDGPRSDRCFDFTVGRCDRGVDCKFEHPDTCFDFSVGKCTRDDCRYFHSEVHYNKPKKSAIYTSQPPAYAPTRRNEAPRERRAESRGYSTSQRAPPPRAYSVAKEDSVCYDFTVGNCDRGDNCKFIHPETCFDFSVDKCTRGESCRFLHPGPQNKGKKRQIEEKLSSRPAASYRQPQRRKEDYSRACFDFTQDNCTRDNCKFSHDPDATTRGDGGDFDEKCETCYDFSVGKCSRGDMCKFIHDPEGKHTPANQNRKKSGRASPY